MTPSGAWARARAEARPPAEPFCEAAVLRLAVPRARLEPFLDAADDVELAVRLRCARVVAAFLRAPDAVAGFAACPRFVVFEAPAAFEDPVPERVAGLLRPLALDRFAVAISTSQLLQHGRRTPTPAEAVLTRA
jgi:hypothetical protein